MQAAFCTGCSLCLECSPIAHPENFSSSCKTRFNYHPMVPLHWAHHSAKVTDFSARPWDCRLLRGRDSELSTRRQQAGRLLIERMAWTKREKKAKSSSSTRGCGDAAAWPRGAFLTRWVCRALDDTESDGALSLAPAIASSLGPRDGEGNPGPDL